MVVLETDSLYSITSLESDLIGSVVFFKVVSSTELIEIKECIKWKNAIGQLLAYSETYPDNKLRLHLFNLADDLCINNFCKKYNILVTYE